MPLTTSTIITLLLVACGAIFATPVLIQGFRRRGKGVKYERNFLIQRAPQLASLLTIAVIALSFASLNGVSVDGLSPALFSWANLLPAVLSQSISWLGIAILFSGMIFMIGGWYSLGECFSTDAEVLDGQTVKNVGLLKYVMHPAYSGIIQCLLGASLAAVSLTSVLLTVCLVAPLWLNRAKYEERLLLETFGESYNDYARQLKWRRLVPAIFPIGV